MGVWDMGYGRMGYGGTGVCRYEGIRVWGIWECGIGVWCMDVWWYGCMGIWEYLNVIYNNNNTIWIGLHKMSISIV